MALLKLQRLYYLFRIWYRLTHTPNTYKHNVTPQCNDIIRTLLTNNIPP